MVSILMALVMLASIVQAGRMVHFKRSAGKVMATLGATPKNGFHGAMALLALVYLARNWPMDWQPLQGFALFQMILFITTLSATAMMGALGAADLLKAREGGLANASLMLTWQSIENYHWNGHHLILKHKTLLLPQKTTRLRLSSQQYQKLRPHLEHAFS